MTDPIARLRAEVDSGLPRYDMFAMGSNEYESAYVKPDEDKDGSWVKWDDAKGALAALPALLDVAACAQALSAYGRPKEGSDRYKAAWDGLSNALKRLAERGET